MVTLFQVMQKLQHIVDPKYAIEYPSSCAYDVENAREVGLAVECMKKCLIRESVLRPTIPQLLDALLLNNTPTPAAEIETGNTNMSWKRISEMVNELSQVP